MSDSLCRLSVLSAGGDGLPAVDLALPRNAHVGLLMPAIVDIVHRDTIAPAVGRRWRLSRVGGSPVDESMTLGENNVHNGELLLLTASHPPTPDEPVADPCHTVAGLAAENRDPVARIVLTAAGLSLAGISATTLAWSGMVTHAPGHIIAGAVLAAGSAAGAVVVRRALPDSLPAVAMSIIAVVFTAVVGFLAVPAGPSAANLLLASAAGLSMATLLLRVIDCGTVCLTATITFTAMATAAAASCALWTLSPAAAGAAVATLALGVLATAPRLSITTAGLAPQMPSADDRTDHEPASGEMSEARAVLAHRTLTGLVIGSSASAVLGTVLVASAGVQDGTSWLSAAAFTAVVGMVLLLRIGTHADIHCRIALGAGGLIGATASVAVVAICAPGQAHWLSIIAAAAGVGALCGFFGSTVNPVARRPVELLEYLALAAVVPLACWVADLYVLVRGMSLA